MDKTDAKIIEFFKTNKNPEGKQLSVLKDELSTLRNKNWQEIHK